jgi:hypothetical protein
VPTDAPFEQRIRSLYAVAVPTELDRRIETAMTTVPFRRSGGFRVRVLAALAVAAIFAITVAGPAIEWLESLPRQIRKAATTRLERVREGSAHQILRCGKVQIAVPRNRELGPKVAREIRAQLEPVVRQGGGDDRRQDDEVERDQGQ